MARLSKELADALRAHRHPRITVVRAGGLGDTLLVMPTLQLLLREAPEAEITLIGSAWAEQLKPLLAIRLRLLRFDSSRLTPLFGPSSADDPVGAFAGAQATVVYAAEANDGLAAAARHFCCGPVIVWPVQPGGAEHAAVHFARAVADPPLSEEELPVPALRVARPLQEWAKQWLEGRFGVVGEVAAVHPGSGGERKCWPADRFARLVPLLGMPVLLLEGPADREACCRLEELVPRGTAMVKAAGLSVAEAAAALSRCRLYVGNDSGLSHLAAALGVPTVAVFGPTDPRVWAPRGARVRVVRACSCARDTWPGADEVASAAQPFLR